MPRMNLPAGLLLTVVLSGAALPQITFAQTCRIVDLGTIGGPASNGLAINTAGQVAGVSMTSAGDLHAFLWSNVMSDLGTLSPYAQSTASDINDASQLATMSFNLGDLLVSGAIWQANVYTPLGSFAPRAIDGTGVCAGFITIPFSDVGQADHAARWQTSVTTDLGTLGGNYSQAFGMNDTGRIVGSAFNTDDAATRAFLWQSGVMSDLGTLGGPSSQAYGVNNVGQIVGQADTATGEPHACLFTVNASGNVTSRTDLGILGGGYSYAYAINDAGQIVGTSDSRAFLWQHGTLTDLNTLVPPECGWTLVSATAINASGQITGTGILVGQPHAFLLAVPVAAPADFDLDGDVDQEDFGHLQLCFTGTGVPYTDLNCRNADLNGDSFINDTDLAVFTGCTTGPQVPATPDCAN